ncbi:hypothetical protein [Pseudoxanthomonas mexicana]|uniref:hypothetical protein n=1 Tax=Pseudoxanthomonas mexicana TaxID=128785 RepID=UPI00398B6C9F
MRGLLTTALVSASVWAGAIAYWRNSGILPGGMQMLAWLGVLPVSLSAGGWMLHSLVVRRLAAREQAIAEDGVAAGTASLQPQDEAVLPAPLELLSAAARLPVGADIAALSATLPTLPRPGLHPRFRDRDDLPVFAAFVHDLDTGPVAHALEIPGMHGDALVPDEEHLRALALLEPVAEELLMAALAALPPMQSREERVVAGLRRMAEPDIGGVLRIEALLPAAWPPALRDAAGEWLRRSAVELGLEPRQLRLETVPVREAIEVWRRLQQICEASPTEPREWRLLLACESSMGERSIARLAAAGTLASGHRPEGVIPGEAACGLLLRRVDAATAGAVPGAVPAVALHRPWRAPAGAGRSLRARTQACGELIASVLRRSGTAPEAVTLLVCDADHRRDALAEAAAAAQSACPELDAFEHCLAPGLVTGCTGHVAPLIALALASGQVRRAQAPALALGLADADERIAVALTPVAVDSPSARHSGPAPDGAG